MCGWGASQTQRTSYTGYLQVLQSFLVIVVRKMYFVLGCWCWKNPGYRPREEQCQLAGSALTISVCCLWMPCWLCRQHRFDDCRLSLTARRLRVLPCNCSVLVYLVLDEAHLSEKRSNYKIEILLTEKYVWHVNLVWIHFKHFCYMEFVQQTQNLFMWLCFRGRGGGCGGDGALMETFVSCEI